VALLAAPASAQKEPKISKDDLRVLLEKVRDKHDVPALGAAVVTSRGLKQLAVVGVRKRGDETKAEEDDLFHLGSDTKAMTATLVAVLAQKKQIVYHRTLAESFPELAEKMPAPLRQVTLTQLLTHHAGLPANLEWFTIPGKGMVAKREEAVRQLLDATPAAKPGEKFVYSNAGYVAVGAVLERAMKKPWEELLVEHVTGPLKMTSVGFGAAGTKGKVDQPLGHDRRGNPVEPGPFADNAPVLGPAGRVHCSLADWARFAADQLHGAQGKPGLLTSQAYRKLHEPAKEGQKYVPGGWLYRKSDDDVELAHDGSNTFNYATAVLLPKKDLAVLVVCNQGPPKGQKAVQAAREAILAKLGR
jgi:CubicO group peptidase (beta-lactamase class C family)